MISIKIFHTQYYLFSLPLFYIRRFLMVFLSPTDVARSFALEVARVLDPTLKIDVETIHFFIYLTFNFVYGSYLLVDLS